MPIPKIEDLKDRSKYKKLLKAELNGVGAGPTAWVLFDKFKFNDKVAPLLLVGDMAAKKPFEDAKETNAPIKGKGKCAKVGEDVAFVADMGSIPLDKLTEDLGGVACKEAKSLNAPPPPAPSDAQLEGAAKAKYELSQKQFAAIKARVGDEDRKNMHAGFGRVVTAMEAGQFGQAIVEMKALEKLMAEAGNRLRQDAQDKEDKAALELENAAKKAAPSFEEVARLTKEVNALTEEQTKKESSKKSMESRKGKGAQESARQMGERLAELKRQLDVLGPQLEEAKKNKASDVKQVKEMEARLKEAATALSLGKAALSEVRKLSDNPELLKAQQAISGKVQEMSDATAWQQEQVKKAEGGANMHGSGRHGAQTGLEKQAQRLSSDVTPDQDHNEGGTARTIGEWRTHKFDIVKGKDGKQKVAQPVKVVQAVLDELGRTLPTKTTSMFLNPVLEKEAVDKAMAIAAQAKDWAEWNDGGTWKPLTSLTVVVPPPKSAKGYGLSMEQRADIHKKSAAAAAALVKQFETGAIKTIDDLMNRLEVQLKTDETGGAAIMPRAKVVFERASASADWVNKTQYPTDDAQGWECKKGATLADKQVRGTGIPAKVAGAYA